MKLLFLNSRQVSQLMNVRECIEVVTGALKEFSAKKVVQPLRMAMWLPSRTGLLGLMPAASEATSTMAAKIISVFPQNRQRGFESHQGVVILFETESGKPLGIFHAGGITAIRTAAASGLATKLLSRSDASSLALLGSGLQAQTHLAAMLAVRPIKTVRVWSRNLEHAAHFAALQSKQSSVEVIAVSTPQEAVTKSDVICTITASTTPVLSGEWLQPGTHVNAVGACTRNARELDSTAMARARIFTDSRESLLNESGDFLIAKDEKRIDDMHLVGEIGDLLLGQIAGRQSAQDITVFESLGIAAEDLASAAFLYDKAVKTGTGTWLDLEGDSDAAS